MGTTNYRAEETSAHANELDPADQTALVAGNTAFAAALYVEAMRADNVGFAPVSISFALAMTYAGARGETATEMARALRFPPLDSARMHAAFGALAATFKRTPGVDLATASALFGQKGHNFLPGFLALLVERYGAGLREVDFRGEPELAREAINEWVKQETKDKITDLLAPGILDALTRLVLVNAVYFKGSWASVFPPENTTQQPFFGLDGASSPVPLMHQSGHCKLVDIGGAQVLELPYEGHAISMVVILPHASNGLSDIEAKLTTDLGAWLQRLDHVSSRDVEVYLPRFRVDAAFHLETALKSLGMVCAFDATHADFAGMTGRPELHIAAVVHKAFVDVNEEGTTAAAATAILMELEAEPDEPSPLFRADHPFMFLIRDTRTKSVLFLGRFVEAH